MHLYIYIFICVLGKKMFKNVCIIFPSPKRGENNVTIVKGRRFFVQPKCFEKYFF